MSIGNKAANKAKQNSVSAYDKIIEEFDKEERDKQAKLDKLVVTLKVAEKENSGKKSTGFAGVELDSEDDNNEHLDDHNDQTNLLHSTSDHNNFRFNSAEFDSVNRLTWDNDVVAVDDSNFLQIKNEIRSLKSIIEENFSRLYKQNKKILETVEAMKSKKKLIVQLN